MHLIQSIFYWASDGLPDAVPAGIIGVDLGLNEADAGELSEVHNYCTEIGLFDDSCWQLGFTPEDVDLVRRIDPDSHRCGYLITTQIVPDWQWELIKQRPGLRIAEHNLAAHEAEMEALLAEEDDQ